MAKTTATADASPATEPVAREAQSAHPSADSRHKESARQSSSPPEITFRVGRVSASVFINQVNANGNGDQRTRRFRSVTLQRSYRDEKSGETRFTSSFGLGEIRNAIRVLELAASHMEEKESAYTV